MTFKPLITIHQKSVVDMHQERFYFWKWVAFALKILLYSLIREQYIGPNIYSFQDVKISWQLLQ
jgi:hypothetical protein